MRQTRMLLRTVKLEESLVTTFVDEAMNIFKVNTAGPIKYLNSYRRYHDLLCGKAYQDVTNFLKEEHSINGFKKVMWLYSCIIAKLYQGLFTQPIWSAGAASAVNGRHKRAWLLHDRHVT